MGDFKHLWVIARDSGVCIFEAQLDEAERDIDADLISGFFTAILQFSRELSSTDIKSMNMSDGVMLFSANDVALFVLWAEADCPTFKAESTLRDLESAFCTKYGDCFAGGWGGNVSEFSDFGQIVEDIANTKLVDKIALKLLGQKITTFDFKKTINEKRDLVRDFISNQTDQIKSLLGRTKIFGKIFGGKNNGRAPDSSPPPLDS
ncbi:MAG TPA: hypothetical protein VKK79_09135 [Candidatus Lokiarchaeia archaeon]|nr:hypothetical protein [Candidatus Lokiarchaeia archaeon]